MSHYRLDSANPFAKVYLPNIFKLLTAFSLFLLLWSLLHSSLAAAMGIVFIALCVLAIQTRVDALDNKQGVDHIGDFDGGTFSSVHPAQKADLERKTVADGGSFRHG